MVETAVLSRRGTVLAVAGAAAVAALAGAAWSLTTGGGVFRVTAGIPDGGAAVAWGLPAARLTAEVAAVLTLGLLIGAALFSPRGRDGALSATGSRFGRLAAVVALGWAAASTAQVVFVAADLSGRPLGDVDPDLLATTALYVAQGRAQLIAAVAGLVVFGLGWLSRRVWSLVVAVTVTAAGTAPVAFAGHAASSLNHGTATVSLAGHVLFAGSWVGGLAALLLLARWDRGALPVAASRFSVLAGICCAAVAVTGVLNMYLRVGSLGRLTGTGYGLVMQAKILALLTLGGFGWWHRTRTLPALREGGNRSNFVRFATVEVIVMAATVGVAVGLGRAQAPGGFDVTGLTAADALLGYRMPGPPTASSLLLDVRPDLFFTTVCAVAAGAYLLGVRELHREQLSWPVHRTACWLAGLLVVFAATGGGLARYAPVLFSAHMVAHMLTAMLAPILLVLGAPITLALRALPAGGDHRFPGPRAWLAAALHSRPVRLLSHPLVAAALWIGGLYVMYFSGAYEDALRNHPVHLAMYAHFILSGYLFFAILIGTDPLPRRQSPPTRMVLLLGALVFHAFFGVALMNTGTVIAADWFTEIARPWGPDPLTDQRTGGGIAWAVGEAPAVLVAVILFRQWVRDDEREQRRLDRAADRDGDAALEAYNAWLAGQPRR